MKEIDPNVKLTRDQFCEIFEQLPLTEEERAGVRETYWEMYAVFLENGVEPRTAWLATRNVFIAKEPQIGERMEKSAKPAKTRAEE